MIELTPIEKNKIERLNEDKDMLRAIEKVFLFSFLQARPLEKDKEVMVLAAARIAIDLMWNAFKEMEKYQKVDAQEKSNLNEAR